LVPHGETSMQPGTPVLASDGEIGKVAGFDVDPQEHHIVQVLVNEGRFPWGRRTVLLPIKYVVAFNARIEVSLTTDQASQIASRLGDLSKD
jgi:hypothetical protein